MAFRNGKKGMAAHGVRTSRKTCSPRAALAPKCRRYSFDAPGCASSTQIMHTMHCWILDAPSLSKAAAAAAACCFLEGCCASRFLVGVGVAACSCFFRPLAEGREARAFQIMLGYCWSAARLRKDTNLTHKQS